MITLTNEREESILIEKIGHLIGHLVVIALFFVLNAAVVRLFCWSFDIGWSWRYPVGVFAASLQVAFIINVGMKK